MTQMKNDITDVPGILVGHAQDDEAMTGCTVVRCDAGAIGGVDSRGGAPGTRETDLLRPGHLVQSVHAVLLAGGSAFGLDAAGGVMRYLAERKIGFPAGTAVVPIVPGAVIFDLEFGKGDVHPDAEMGYRACEAASGAVTAQGSVGAGCGATVGKILGMGSAMKSGIGSASLRLSGGVIVAALIVVNAFGDVIDPATGQILAGARLPAAKDGSREEGFSFVNTIAVMKEFNPAGFDAQKTPVANTTIGVIATNARLTKEEANKVAQMAHDGLARAIRPIHTMFDGDTLFALATGEAPADVNLVGSFAAEVAAQACVNAIKKAGTQRGLPGLMGDC